jgi:predicted nucleic acid-binding Zn ribbon protein
MVNEDERLLNITKWRKKRGHGEATKLGQTIGLLMENRFLPNQNRFGPVVDCWEQLLPEELSRHCRINGMGGGQLEVLADSPAYMHELRMCSPQLLEQLQQKCPRARIKKIKLALGKQLPDDSSFS